MQSQQKKVKWSRGETADALEERTDTGITNVSVSRLENCTCDILTPYILSFSKNLMIIIISS